MKGIDVSNFQSNLDFNKVDAEVCIIKATEGLTYTNPSLKHSYSGAKAKGMKVGYYHYLRANDAISEAKHFLNTINGLDNNCRLIIDVEETKIANNKTENAGISARTRKFADYLISQGKEVALYSGLSFYNTEILPNCKDIPLWVAAYGNTRPTIKSVGWQYSGTGAVDLNIFDAGILLSTIKPIAAKVMAQPNNVVKQTQIFLNSLGFVDQSGHKLIADGIPGLKTKYVLSLLSKKI